MFEIIKKSICLCALLLCCQITPAIAENDSPLNELEKKSRELIRLEEQILADLQREEEEEKAEKKEEAGASFDSFAYKEDDLQIPEAVNIQPKIEKPVIPPTEVYETSYLKAEIERLNKSVENLKTNNSEMRKTIDSMTYQKLHHSDVVDAYYTPGETYKKKYKTYVTVVHSPAVLRTAPSRESTRIFQIPLGTNLPVVLRRGSWFKVVASSGIYAWLPADVLSDQMAY